MKLKPLIKFGVPLIGVIVMGTFSKASAQFARGADMSWLAESEQRGQKYYDANGAVGDGLAIVKSLGINAVRLRTWINPSGGHCSQKETIHMAMRCKKLGLRVLINFHYNNSWVSVGERHTPKEWANMDYPTMCQALYDYAYGFCKEMKDSGVTPEWFQNGNETNGGLCPPTGELSQHPDQMTGLLNNGYKAIHAVFPLPATKVLIHVAQPQKTEGAAMVRTYIANGGKLDAIGWSSYANSGNVDSLVTNVKKWHDEFKLETYMVEIGTKESSDKRKILIDKWNAGIQAMDNACEGGTFYWEPDGYGVFQNPDALFDATGHPDIVAWSAYTTPISKPCVLAAPMRFLENASAASGKIVCFMNPFTNRISLRLAGQFRYSLFDLNGKKLLSGNALNSIEVGYELKTGVYVVEICNKRATSVVKISKS